jgi:hypothetical protein
VNSWRDENVRRVTAKRLELAEARAERIATATEAFEARALPPPAQSSGATAASDLIEPLVWALSKTIELPAMGNPAMDELFTHLQSSARGVADETVKGLVRGVQYGDRPQLFAALGGALFVGWFLGHHNHRKST